MPKAKATKKVKRTRLYVVFEPTAEKGSVTFCGNEYAVPTGKHDLEDVQWDPPGDASKEDILRHACAQVPGCRMAHEVYFEEVPVE